MLEFTARAYYFIAFMLESLRRDAKHGPQNANIPPRLKQAALNVLKKIEANCEYSELTLSREKALELKTRVEQGVSRAVFRSQAFVLRDLLHGELKHVVVFQVPRDKKTYLNGHHAFSDEVVAKYPSVARDIKAAGECLAIGQNPACVFHVMRVAEAGLRVIAKELGIGYAREPGWGKVLREIERTLEQRPPQDRLKNKLAEPYRYLKDVKGLWRDTTMHVDETFSPERAEFVLSSVAAFMKGLVAKGSYEKP